MRRCYFRLTVIILIYSQY